MNKSSLYQVDEFGVKNYKYSTVAVLSLLIFTLLNLSLGYVTYINEISVDGSPVQSYADAVWLMVMSASTIGFGDVYPITLAGRVAVFVMFILGVGILGGAGAIFANKIFGFADTNIKNRELRKQNEEIIAQNHQIQQQLDKLEEKLSVLTKLN
jgi:hypothetical protein